MLSASAVNPRMSLNSTAVRQRVPPSRTEAGSLAMRAASAGAKYRSKLLRTSASRRMRSANALFSMAMDAIPEKAMRKSRSSSSKRSARVRLSTYSTPRTTSSLPMRGAHIAERTLWRRIDSPPKRRSSPASSEMMATLSRTTFRAMDCGTARVASGPW